uniref:(California timema) hypothetical protein n=1 Tax=Timema californicum TaxID=61474 RepID=A0A7R9J5D5_TIMCA|nr:unnamed protein product [Timema californicum]
MSANVLYPPDIDVIVIAIYSSPMASLVLADSFEKLPDQFMYPYTEPYDLQNMCLAASKSEDVKKQKKEENGEEDEDVEDEEDVEGEEEDEEEELPEGDEDLDEGEEEEEDDGEGEGEGDDDEDDA